MFSFECSSFSSCYLILKSLRCGHVSSPQPLQEKESTPQPTVNGERSTRHEEHHNKLIVAAALVVVAQATARATVLLLLAFLLELLVAHHGTSLLHEATDLGSCTHIISKRARD